MSKVTKTFGAYQSVKVTDKEYERFGHVGTYVGPGDEPGEVAIKFENESGNPRDPQQTDTFPVEAVEGV